MSFVYEQPTMNEEVNVTIPTKPIKLYVWLDVISANGVCWPFACQKLPFDMVIFISGGWTRGRNNCIYQLNKWQPFNTRSSAGDVISLEFKWNISKNSFRKLHWHASFPFKGRLIGTWFENGQFEEFHSSHSSYIFALFNSSYCMQCNKCIATRPHVCSRNYYRSIQFSRWWTNSQLTAQFPLFHPTGTGWWRYARGVDTNYDKILGRFRLCSQSISNICTCHKWEIFILSAKFTFV